MEKSDKYSKTYNNTDFRVDLDFREAILHPGLEDRSQGGLDLYKLFRKVMIGLGVRSESLRHLALNASPDDNRIKPDTGGDLSGLYTTPSGGRSEVVELRIDPVNEPETFHSVCTAIELICPHLVDEATVDPLNRIRRLVEFGIQVKVKGRGPKGISKLSINHFEQKVGINGFTGHDFMEAEFESKLAGKHQVIDPQGEEVEYKYVPSRSLLAAIPFSSIEINDKDSQGNYIKLQPQEWQEWLYLEIFLEFGGQNLKDIADAKLTIDQKVEYYRRISKAFPIFDDIDWDSDTAMDQFAEKLVLKCYYDAQVETKFYRIGDNRSIQNFTVGEQDTDDSPPRDNADEQATYMKHFCAKLARLGIVFTDHIFNLLTIDSYDMNGDGPFSVLSKMVRHVPELPIGIHKDIGLKLVNRILQNADLARANHSALLREIIVASSRMEANINNKIYKLMLDKEYNLGTERSDMLCHILDFGSSIGGDEFFQLLMPMLDSGFDLGQQRSLVLAKIAGSFVRYKHLDRSKIFELMLKNDFDLGNEPFTVFKAIIKSAFIISKPEGNATAGILLGINFHGGVYRSVMIEMIKQIASEMTDITYPGVKLRIANFLQTLQE